MLAFVTFANSDYMNTHRIEREARAFEMFDHIWGRTEHDIPDFLAHHQELIHAHRREGYGLWVWKPKIILDALEQLNEGDVLVYADAGMHLHLNGKRRFEQYLDKLSQPDVDMVTFCTSPHYRPTQYVKMDAIQHCYPPYVAEAQLYRYAGIMIIKKTACTVELITEWLALCENHHLLDRSRSVTHRDLPHYNGNDCDNGLLNVCLCKYKLDHPVFPDETNIYDMNDKQWYHTRIGVPDWSVLDKYPFHYRRLTPKNPDMRLFPQK